MPSQRPAQPRQSGVARQSMSDDREKLLSVFAHYRAALLRFLTRRVGNVEAAKDLTQETWLKLASGPAPAGVINPQAYLFRVASNLATDSRRAEQRRALSATDAQALLEIPDQAPDPAATTEGRLQIAALRRALAEMPERRRAIFVLSRVQGLSHREIAERFAISTRTVEKEVVRALYHCAARLERSVGGKFGSRPPESS
jgi:RNA polymerase sigma factor (sigma-70 family)